MLQCDCQDCYNLASYLPIFTLLFYLTHGISNHILISSEKFSRYFLVIHRPMVGSVLQCDCQDRYNLASYLPIFTDDLALLIACRSVSLSRFGGNLYTRTKSCNKRQISRSQDTTLPPPTPPPPHAQSNRILKPLCEMTSQVSNSGAKVLGL